ncbi:helix-turn-helix domain-containing protein [Formicincola oecophyllae]|uniref:Helix-turn-helix domain-containing protein n=1 Tax=Formicincola oecophyllae TaxID=2558361 RepID=A0A4Y6UAE2_9PROT|nr:cyclic nucleotide-binding domain-containing protein [Formicincola oecophyllae]QDH13548.1 helix-turn-helix domain-containing protein [Formicincola oecophyllae]
MATVAPSLEEPPPPLPSPDQGQPPTPCLGKVGFDCCAGRLRCLWHGLQRQANLTELPSQQAVGQTRLLQEAHHITEHVQVAAGQCFIEASEKARHYHVVASGRVKLYRSLPDGRRQITALLGAGDFIGLSAGENYNFNAEALGPVSLCRLGRGDMECLAQAIPLLARRLRQEACRELAHSQDRLVLLGRKTARERVSTFLLECLHAQDRTCPSPMHPVREWSMRPVDNLAGLMVTLWMPRTDIADYLGLTVETVSRTFSAFRQEGLISLQGACRVTFLQPRQLMELATGHQ